MRVTSRIVCRLLVAVTLTSVNAAAQGSRMRVLDYESPPEELSEAIQKSNLIVLGRVEGRTQRVAGTGQFALPVVDHELRIIQVVKGPSSIKPKQVLRVSQPGGSAVVGGLRTTTDERGFVVFAEGQTLLLFLGYDKFLGEYAPVYGPGSVFPSDSADKVKVPNAARRVAAFEKREDIPLAEFLAILRAHGAER